MYAVMGHHMWESFVIWSCDILWTAVFFLWQWVMVCFGPWCLAFPICLIAYFVLLGTRWDMLMICGRLCRTRSIGSFPSAHAHCFGLTSDYDTRYIWLSLLNLFRLLRVFVQMRCGFLPQTR